MPAIDDLLIEDMANVNQLIVDSLHSDIPAIQQVGDYIIKQNSKRLPSVVFLLAIKALDYKGEQHIRLAVILDFIYTAICLHENKSHNNSKHVASRHPLSVEASRILLGDFLYSKAFSMMVDLGQMRIVERLSYAITRHTEGRVLQSSHSHTATYRHQSKISKATLLFEVIAQLGAVLSHSSTTTEKALSDYGQHFGLAMQMSHEVVTEYNKGVVIDAVNKAQLALHILPVSPYRNALASLANALVNTEKSETFADFFHTS